MNNGSKKGSKKSEELPEKRMDSVIKFRIAKDEKILVCEYAESIGLNVSEYIRRLAIDDAERVLSK